LMDGLIAYDHGKGFRAPVASIEIGEDWGLDVAKIAPLSDVPEWQLAVVLEMGGNEARIGLRPDGLVGGALADDRIVGTLSGPEIKWVSKPLQDILKVGDVIYVSPVSGK